MDLKAVEKHELQSAAYTKNVVSGIMDKLFTRVATITNKEESEMKLMSHYRKNVKCNK